MAARCETVLNTTMAEMDVYHAHKSEELKAVVEDHLDGEIRFYEQVCVCVYFYIFLLPVTMLFYSSYKSTNLIFSFPPFADSHSS